MRLAAVLRERLRRCHLLRPHRTVNVREPQLHRRVSPVHLHVRSVTIHERSEKVWRFTAKCGEERGKPKEVTPEKTPAILVTLYTHDLYVAALEFRSVLNVETYLVLIFVAVVYLWIWQFGVLRVLLQVLVPVPGFVVGQDVRIELGVVEEAPDQLRALW